MKDCRECYHGQKMVNHNRMCDAMHFLRTVEYQRHDKSECGPEARLFTPMSDKKYAEFDDD